MSKLRKCLYLFKLLRTNNEISTKEIHQKFSVEFPFEDEMSRSTLGRYIDFIEENFHCRVEFDNSRKTYSLYRRAATYNEDEQTYKYLMSMYDVQSSSSLLLKHSDRIHNAEILSGTENLNIILKAIDEKKGYTCEYHSYKNGTHKTRTFIPIFLTSWEGRWYVVAEVNTHKGDLPYTYALDRMSDIKLSDDIMTPSSDIRISEYFKDSYGIQHADESKPPVKILLKAIGPKVDYLKSRPIHSSQELKEEHKGYAIFTLFLTPCYNFYQQLLWHREEIEILQPQSVKDELKQIVANIYKLYD